MLGLSEFPAPREVDREIYPLEQVALLIAQEFPAPLEVDREIYKRFSHLKIRTMSSFRPLSRFIGNYTDFVPVKAFIREFPAPFEVDREIYR